MVAAITATMALTKVVRAAIFAGNAKNVNLVKISDQRVGNDIERHATDAGENGHSGHEFSRMRLADFENLMSDQPYNESDQEL